MAPPDDLWPDDAFRALPMPTPRQLVLETASALTERTGGSLRGEVVSSAQENTMNHQFCILAPALDYRKFLFRVYHPVDAMYPAKLWSQSLKQESVAADHDALRGLIRNFLATEPIKKIVSSLLAQATAS